MNSIAEELENSELIHEIISGLDGLCLENAAIRLKAKLTLSLDSSEELQFICKHIDELWSSIVAILDVDTLSLILSNNLLEIPNEDWLLRTLINFVESDSAKLSLFEFVYFEAVSVDGICEFTRFISPFFEQISNALWQRLCRRLICEVKALPGPFFLRGSRPPVVRGRDICYESGHPFDGIILYFTMKHGWDLPDLGIVDATSSSRWSDWAAKWCLDRRSDKGFLSVNAPNQWLQLDFKDMSIIATHYSIMSRHDSGKGGPHPRSWVVEVSFDKTKWSVVDRRDDDDHLNGDSVQHTFEIAKPTEGRYFRLRQTGPTHRNDHYFGFTNLEIFGRLLGEASPGK
jgi:hypothetical protein